MTFDLTKFLPLFEKCPELRPKGLTRRSYGWEAEGPNHDPYLVSLNTAAALIRDRAVWWLAKLNKIEMLGVTEPPTPEYRAINPEHWKDTPDYLVWNLHTARDHDDYGTFEGVSSPDHTELVYLACCKVLGVEP